MNAKIVLICDRDIMKLDVSKLDTLMCETLLVTTLVSDWNTRAWTFLEAFRGRKNIHILCGNNAVLPTKDIIQKVHDEGSLDISILFLAAPHLLPSLND